MMPIMSAPTGVSSQSKLDLRASLLLGTRRGIGVRWLRFFSLVLLDAIILALAWQTATVVDPPVYSDWNTQSNPLSLLLIITTQVSLSGIQGLYSSGQKRRDYFSLIKTLLFSHMLLLIIAFFYDPNELLVSRSAFILSFFLSISLTFIARFTVNLTIDYFRKKVQLGILNSRSTAQKIEKKLRN